MKSVTAFVRPGAGIICAFLCVAVHPAGATVTYSDLYVLTPPAGYTNGTTQLTGVTGGQVVGYGSDPTNGSIGHGTLWSPFFPGGIDLTPSGYGGTTVNGIGAGQQVGVATGTVPTADHNHAALWTGSAASFVDLNPPFSSGLTDSEAFGTSGTRQVGIGYVYTAPPDTNHALLWSGTSTSYVDLHPAGFTNTFGIGVSGNQEVGFGAGPLTGNTPHAILWTGTAASHIDLNPTASGFTTSFATNTNGSKQVGYGLGSATGQNFHGLLWSGTAGSFIDLNPTAGGFTLSEVLGLDGTHQVGYGVGAATGGNNHALVWSGTAGSYLDLGAVLPASFVNSKAYSVNDNLVYGYGQDTSGAYHAIEWDLAGVPEPSNLAALGIAALLYFLARRRPIDRAVAIARLAGPR